MPTDTKLNSLIINYLTEAQYKETTPNENELYRPPDRGGIEIINGTLNEDSAITLEKAVTKVPTVIQISMGDIKLIGTVTNAVNVSTEATIYDGMMNAISFYDATDVPQDATSVYSIKVIGTTATLTKCIMPNDIYDDNLEKDKVLTATKYNNFFTYQWKDYPDVSSIQKKTFLHSITAKGATLSMSFTYPSTNQLPVDSQQDATTVIKPTANEYFASPVVVIATKKISDGYNCIHYDGTSWKFALWDGTSFTDGEAVTTWADSVVAVD